MRINIDGKEIETRERKTILELARENDIYIPSLCDFKGLEPFSGCRLCLVKVEGMKGYVPSCSVFVKEGMKVKTKTSDIQKLRKNILELILTEHPNACLICEEKENCDEHKFTIRKVDEVTGCVLCPNNGRCELQNVVREVGLEKIKFPSFYRDLEVKKDDPFFDRNYNLCILCGRCVRVCRDVRGLSVITFIRRGANTVIGTSLGRSLLDSGCQFCGACVDVCPTGALTEKAVKYDNPSDKKKNTVCPLCSIGCSLEFNFFEDNFLGADPAGSSPVNNGQACVRGRFALRDVVQSEDRIRKPLIRKNDQLEGVTWEEALDYASEKLKKYKPDEIAVITSPQLSCEDIFVFNKFAEKVLKTKHINQKTEGSPLSLIYNASRKHGISLPIQFKLDDISELDAVFLMGGNLMESTPIVWLSILKALDRGADLITAGFLGNPVVRHASKKLWVNPGMESYLLAFLSKCIMDDSGEKEFKAEKGFEELKRSLDGIPYKYLEKSTGVDRKTVKQTADILRKRGRSGLIFAPQLIGRDREDAVAENLLNLAFLSDSRIFPLSVEGNYRGWDAINKDFSERTKSLTEIVNGIKKGQYKALYTAAPIDIPDNTGLELLIVQDCFAGDNLDKANVVLPACVLPETDGSIVNTEGRIQGLRRPLDSLGDAKPDWEIVSELAGKMGSKDFGYTTAGDIRKEMALKLPRFRDISQTLSKRGRQVFLKEDAGYRKKFIPLSPLKELKKETPQYPLRLVLEHGFDYYRSCMISEEIPEFDLFRSQQWIKINKKDARKYKLKEGFPVTVESKEGQFKGVILISEYVPAGIVTAYSMPDRDGNRADMNLSPVKITRGK
jgi:formate dehydrogenase alpha subunit